MCTTRRPARARRRGGDRGAVAGAAVHPHLPGGHVVEAAAAARGSGMCTAPSTWPARHSLSRARRARRRRGRLGGRHARRPGRRSRRPGSCAGRTGRRPTARGLPVAAAAGRSMPMRTSSRWASATCSGGLAEQGHRGAPRDQPAQVGANLPVQAEVQRAGQVPGGERRAVAQVDHPLPGGDPAAQLVGVGARRRRTGRLGSGPAALAGAHVGVVRGVGVQPGQQSSATKSSLVQASAPGWPCLLPADGGLGRVGWVAEQKLPNPWVG